MKRDIQIQQQQHQETIILRLLLTLKVNYCLCAFFCFKLTRKRFLFLYIVDVPNLNSRELLFAFQMCENLSRFLGFLKGISYRKLRIYSKQRPSNIEQR